MRRKWLLSGLIALAVAVTLAVSPAAAQDTGRPSLPDEQTVGTEHFLIHYTTSGDQAVDPTDQDGNGVPDYVDQVAEALEYSWQVEVEEYGWAPPPTDRGEGGDDRIDVYLENLMDEGFAGYTDSEGGYVGDNPLTPEIEHHAAYSYMGLDNDYAELLDDPRADETPLQLMQATVAHEFNHVLQGGYDDSDPQFWLYEATATWMEDEVFPDVNDGVHYLDAVFGSPDTCLVAEEPVRGDNSGHWYAMWLLLRMLSERHGQEVVRNIWEHSRVLSGFDAIDAALEPYGESMLSASRDFAVANLLRAYTEGHLYPSVRLEGTAGPGTFVPGDGVQSLGVDYVRLTGNGVVSVTLADAEARLNVLAVGVRGREADLLTGTGDALVVDMGAYQDVFLIVHNEEMIAHEQACFLADYTLEIAPATGEPSPVAATWPAANFIQPGEGPPPEENGYLPPEGVPFNDGEFAEDPMALDVSFEPILPASLPEGYAFDYAYIMTAEDFGESADYYVPGGGDSANYDYLDDEGNWLSIAESVSPYTTLQEWLDDISYDTPGEIRDISGVEVLVEDLSDEDGAWISATMIMDGLFIVVDGDHTEEEVLALVEGLIAASGNLQPDIVPEREGDNAPPAAEIPSPAPENLPTPPVPDVLDVDTSPAIGTGELIGMVALGLCGLGICLAIVIIPLIVLGVRAGRKRREAEL